MASIERRTTSKGKITYRVRWHDGGTRTGPWQSATFRRQQEAKDFKARVEACGHHWPDDTTGAVSAPGTATIDTLAQDYLADRAKRVRSDRTIADYRRDYRNWIGPHLGQLRADDLTAETVQEWVDGMTAGIYGKPLSAKSACDRHALLSGILERAVSKEVIDANPCARTDLPRKQKGAPKGLRPAEWAALHAALRQIDPDAADLAEFLLASGWRWSEAAALTTYDVEDYGHTLYVTMGQVVRRNAAGQHVIVTEGKGQASVRRITLDLDAADMVRHRTARAAPGGLVFTTRTGRQWHYANFLNRIWRPAVKAANLSRPPSPHWLRHTAVVWLAQSGATLPELQARIGHASIQTTIGVYGRMLTDVDATSLASFAAMRRGALPSADYNPRQISTGE